MVAAIVFSNEFLWENDWSAEIECEEAFLAQLGFLDLNVSTVASEPILVCSVAYHVSVDQVINASNGFKQILIFDFFVVYFIFAHFSALSFISFAAGAAP